NGAGRPGRRRLCLVPASPDISEMRESRAPRTVALSTRFRLHSMRLSRAAVLSSDPREVHESFDRALRDARHPQVPITSCVRVPDGDGGRRQEIREFRTTTAGLVTLADWLRSWSVTVVGMESTGWSQEAWTRGC